MVKEGRERSQDVMGIVLSLLLRAFFIFLAATESREPSILAWNRLLWFLEREKKGKKERKEERERKKEGKVTRWFENRLEVSKVWRGGG